jgi:hypothetical protein
VLNRFSDRDLMMRFRGGGVGHKSTREATDFFKNDRDGLDKLAVDDDGEMESEEELELEHEIDEDEEDDYGYTGLESDTDSLSEQEAAGDDDDNEYFGPEDNGGAVDPDMDALGYADL